jgi:hypothetical protein
VTPATPSPADDERGRGERSSREQSWKHNGGDEMKNSGVWNSEVPVNMFSENVADRKGVLSLSKDRKGGKVGRVEKLQEKDGERSACGPHAVSIARGKCFIGETHHHT